MSIAVCVVSKAGLLLPGVGVVMANLEKHPLSLCATSSRRQTIERVRATVVGYLSPKERSPLDYITDNLGVEMSEFFETLQHDFPVV